MNDVNKLLEKNEVARDGSDARTNQNAVEPLLLKFCGDHRLCRLTKVNKTMLCVIAKSLQTFFCCGDSRQHLLSRQARECGEIWR